MAGYSSDRWNVGESGKTGALGIAWYDGRGHSSIAGADNTAGPLDNDGAFFTRVVNGQTVVADEVRDYVIANTRVISNPTSAPLEVVALTAQMGFATSAAAAAGTPMTAIAAGDNMFIPANIRGGGTLGLVKPDNSDGGFVPIGLLMRNGFQIVGFYFDPTSSGGTLPRVKPVSTANQDAATEAAFRIENNIT